MFEEIDTTIQSVERLYRAVSGREANGVEPTPIPPERDAAKHVDEQVDKLLTSLSAKPVAPLATRPAMPAWAPPVCVFARNDELVICVDVPGVAREHLTLTLTPNALTVSGRRAMPWVEGQTRLTRAEAPLGAFRREIALPPDVALADITASLKDGVLEIRAPRAQKQPARTVGIQ